ncbi:hypothetical protein [Sciscionella marina]|uniref:Vgb family protein n=1 Tax=Sciscionella marina TaxID=508770 RepID=UPI000379D228|nr:hypothetical protein [Sciscionella marina]
MQPRYLLTLAAVLLLAGCTGAEAPHPRPPAAEPAVAPPLRTQPAGRVMPVGASPEGIVVDARTRRVAVGAREPDALVLVNADTHAVAERIRLPGHLRHLQLAAPGGPVLVPDENANRLLEIAPSNGKVTASVPTGPSPHDATSAANGTVFVANEAGHSVVAVRGTTVVHRFTESPQPAGLAAVGDQVALVDVADDSLRLFDAATLRQTARLPAGDGPTHQVADRHGRFVVVDTRGGALLVYSSGPSPRRIARMPLPGKPYGVTYDRMRDRVWVTLTARNQLVGVDTSGARPRVVARLPTVRQPNSVGVDAATGRLWVTGTATGQLQSIDADAY